MSAQYSLKSLADAALDRAFKRTLSAQCEKRPHNTPHIAQNLSSGFLGSDIEVIRQWLFSIGEPESAHFLVLNKCKNDQDALIYFLRHARGEFEVRRD